MRIVFWGPRVSLSDISNSINNDSQSSTFNFNSLLMIIRPLKALRAEWFCTFWKLTWFTLFRFYFLFETFVIVSQHVVHEHVKKLMDKLKGNFSWCCIENWRFSLFSIFFHFFCSGACKFFSLRDAKLILPLQTPMVIPCV